MIFITYCSNLGLLVTCLHFAVGCDFIVVRNMGFAGVIANCTITYYSSGTPGELHNITPCSNHLTLLTDLPSLFSATA